MTIIFIAGFSFGLLTGIGVSILDAVLVNKKSNQEPSNPPKLTSNKQAEII